MPATPAAACSCAVSPRPAEMVNREIRLLVARTPVWSRESLRELTALQAEWRAAVVAEEGMAA